ncbi:acyl carrier protein [Candidatus Pelagibacter sp.]|nr:acyl carrier protein [Candidatus Pelagibacter sp.]|tara:strand:+ start:343 stop:585 length:243 start_codon:yes stop_codon:yes gene_type:complete
MKISEEDLKKIIAKSLNVKPTKIVNDLNSNKMEEWDSLGQLSIISSLDKKFKGKIDLSKVANLYSFKDIKNFLKKKSIMK